MTFNEIHAMNLNQLALNGSTFIPFRGGDKELVAEACWANGLALQYAPDFKDDWEVVMCAVSKNGTALMWASDVLRSDKEAHAMS